MFLKFAFTEELVHRGIKFTKYSDVRAELGNTVKRGLAVLPALGPAADASAASVTPDVAAKQLEAATLAMTATTGAAGAGATTARDISLSGPYNEMRSFFKVNPTNVPFTLHSACQRLAQAVFARASMQNTLSLKGMLTHVIWPSCDEGFKKEWITILLNIGELVVGGVKAQAKASKKRR